MYCQLSGKTLEHQQVHTAILEAIPSPRAFATLRDGGEVVACAIGIVYAHALSIVDVVTAPERRGRGYASALLSHLFAWAQGHGATDAALQVQGDPGLSRDEGNAAARALYARGGFREAYRYWYRVSP